jgi:hypothetical protein
MPPAIGSPEVGQRPTGPGNDRHVLMRTVILLIAAVLVGGAAGYLVGVSRPTAVPTWSGDPLLDGTLPIRTEALADLARDRAAMGARWLAGTTRDDGSFFYLYDPASDAYETEDYNEVRHAGTTYSLFMAYGATDEQSVLDAAEGGARYIDENSRAVAGRQGRAFLYQGRTKLGGQALALVALLERRRVLSDTSRIP